jgi:hypothetical protein
MALPYRKWTEEDIKNRNTSPEGDYPFRIISAKLTKTKPGLDKNGQPKSINPMLELELEFNDTNGVIKKTRDWIVFIEGMDWKLRHLANTTGLIELYDNNNLSEYHLLNKTGIFTLGIKEVDEQGIKKKMNFIKDYVKKSSEQTQDKSFIDDDIPL